MSQNENDRGRDGEVGEEEIVDEIAPFLQREGFYIN